MHLISCSSCNHVTSPIGAGWGVHETMLGPTRSLPFACKDRFTWVGLGSHMLVPLSDFRFGPLPQIRLAQLGVHFRPCHPKGPVCGLVGLIQYIRDTSIASGILVSSSEQASLFLYWQHIHSLSSLVCAARLRSKKAWLRSAEFLLWAV